MTHPSKRKGNSFERELVNGAVARGLRGKRAYASDGQSLGLGKEVDCLIAGWPVQAKRRKAIAKYLKIPGGCKAVAFRENRGETYVLMTYDSFLDLLKGQRNGEKGN